eukprot:evm.model.NODE_1774_length_14472_cov_27.124170.5
MEPPDGWSWEWEWREKEVGGGRGMPFASLCLTRSHRLQKEVGKEEEGKRCRSLVPEGYGIAKADEKGVEGEEEDPCALPMLPPTSIPSETEMVVADWELHIVYDEIYNTPTLWLKATRSDGVPLTREEVACLCRVGVGEGGEERGGGRTVLSQDEHPILGQPFFFLHPCGTPGRMARLLIEGERVGEDDDETKKAQIGLTYLVKWFSLVAPVLGLSFPPTFVQAMLL